MVPCEVVRSAGKLEGRAGEKSEEERVDSLRKERVGGSVYL